MKQADMPSCLGGGEQAINLVYWVDHKLTCTVAKLLVEVRILLSQLVKLNQNYLIELFLCLLSKYFKGSPSENRWFRSHLFISGFGHLEASQRSGIS